MQAFAVSLSVTTPADKFRYIKITQLIRVLKRCRQR